jgi:hypothetical protein
MCWAGIQVEDKFSPYAKETLAKLIAFVEVRPSEPSAHKLTHSRIGAFLGRGHPRAEGGSSPTSGRRGPVEDGDPDY